MHVFTQEPKSPYLKHLHHLQKQFPTKHQPDSSHVEVWKRYLITKVEVCRPKNIMNDVCVGCNIPVDLAQRICEACQGICKLYAWSKDGLVTLYIGANPGRLHERVVGIFATEFLEEAREATGAWARENLVQDMSTMYEITCKSGSLWKCADLSFLHWRKGKISINELPSETDFAIEVAHKNETAPTCLQEALYWTDSAARACLVIKIYTSDKDGEWSQPYLIAFLLVRGQSGARRVWGPLNFGAYSDCIGPGMPGCSLKICTSLFTRDTADPYPPSTISIDFWTLKQKLYRDMGLAADDPGARLPSPNGFPLRASDLRQWAAQHGIEYGDVTKDNLAWFE